MIEIISVLVIVLAVVWFTGRLRFNPFLTLCGAGLVCAVILLPPDQVFPVFLGGFGTMIGNIALIIIFGALLGNLLQACGAIEDLAKSLFRGFLSRNPDVALGIGAVLVGIPVFCDAGYVILSHINRAAKLSKSASIRSSVMLAAGLYLAHTLIPPTPGPVAVMSAYNLTGQAAVFIAVGLGLSLCALGVLFLYLRIFAITGNEPGNKTSEPPQTRANWLGILPLALPLVLIALGTTLPVAGKYGVVMLLTHPVGALAAGCILAMVLYRKQLSKNFGNIFSDTIEKTSSIILLTGAGGALGKVVAEGMLPDLDFSGLDNSSVYMMLLAIFATTAMIKTIQGSSTAAMVIASAIFAPLVLPLNNSLMLLCASLCTGAGALCLSHTNDSYFWVISRFENWTVAESIRRWTLVSALLGITTFVLALAIYYFGS